MKKYVYSLLCFAVLCVSTAYTMEFNKHPFVGLDNRIVTLGVPNSDWNNRIQGLSAVVTEEVIETMMAVPCYQNFCETKAFFALSLATPGACEWLKHYLPTNEQEKQCVSKVFLKAASQGKIDAMSKLLELGVNIDTSTIALGECCQEHRVMTAQAALITAVRQGNIDVTHFLLQHGANPNITTTKRYSTPLIITMRRLAQAECTKNHENFYKYHRIMILLLCNPHTNIFQKDRDQKNVYSYVNENNLGWVDVFYLDKHKDMFPQEEKTESKTSTQYDHRC